MDLKALRAALIAAGVKLADDAADDAVLSAACEKIGLLMTVASTTEAVAASVRTKLGLSSDADGTMIAAKISELSTGKVDASEYAAVKARLETVELGLKTRESQELIATAIETAKLNPNNEKQMAYAREHAKRDAVDFKNWMEAAPELYSPGRIVTPSKKLDGVKSDSREGMIAASMAEYAENKDRLRGTEAWAFVNQELFTAGMAKLSADERKSLKA